MEITEALLQNLIGPLFMYLLVLALVGMLVCGGVHWAIHKIKAKFERK